MKANEARKKSIEVMDRDIDCYSKIKEIYGLIEKTANKGKLKINLEIDYRYHDYVSTKLVDNGYKISIVFKRFEINW